MTSTTLLGIVCFLFSALYLYSLTRIRKTNEAERRYRWSAIHIFATLVLLEMYRIVANAIEGLK